MPPAAIPIQDIKSLIQLSNWAPSPDNCQPWNFEWDGEILSIFHDSDRARHPLNPQNCASVLSLGCLLEGLRISASQLGLKPDFIYLPMTPDSQKPWVHVRLQKWTGPIDPLAPLLQLRETDRRFFKQGKEKLESFWQSQGQPFANTYLRTDLDSEIVNYAMDADELFMEHPTALAAVMGWVRFSVAESRTRGDGFSWKNALANFWEIPAMWMFHKAPKITAKIGPFLKPQHRKRVKNQICTSAGLICVSAPLTEARILDRDLIQATGTMMKIWLEMTKLGFGVQPVSFMTFPILYRHKGLLDCFFSTKIRLFDRGEKLLREKFKIPENHLPIWIFRTGISTALPPSLRTFRRPVDEILRIKAGQ